MLFCIFGSLTANLLSSATGPIAFIMAEPNISKVRCNRELASHGIVITLCSMECSSFTSCSRTCLRWFLRKSRLS